MSFSGPGVAMSSGGSVAPVPNQGPPPLSYGTQVDGLPGIVAPDTPYGISAAGGAFSAGRLYLARFMPYAPVQMLSTAIAVTAVATVDDAAGAAIYGLNPLDPTSLVLLGSSPMLAGGRLTSVGLTSYPYSAPVQLQARTIYYASFLAPAFGGTGATVALVSTANSAFWSCFMATPPHSLLGSLSGQVSFPANITAPGYSGTPGMVCMALRPF